MRSPSISTSASGTSPTTASIVIAYPPRRRSCVPIIVSSLRRSGSGAGTGPAPERVAARLEVEVVDVGLREHERLADRDRAVRHRELAELAGRERALALERQLVLQLRVDRVDRGVAHVGRAPEDAVLDQALVDLRLHVARDAQAADRH